MVLMCFSGIILAVNGGFSVAGLERGTRIFNDAGKAAWVYLSYWHFQLPPAPGIPRTQPIIPWLGVLAISALQIAVIYRKLMRYGIPTFMVFIALAASAYDLATTWYGLGNIAWVIAGGPLLQSISALLITFSFEFIVSFTIKQLRGSKAR